MRRWLDALRGVSRELRTHWHAAELTELVRELSGRPPRSGDPEIDAIVAELYAHRPQKF
jgi:hypothetical protein